MPDSTGAALSGAASGAAAGTAILPGWGTAIGAVVGGIGGLLSGSGTADAQSAQNKALAQQAAAQSAQSFLNYLSSRGLNVQQLIANDPRGSAFWTGQYANAQAQGDKRDFNTWFVAALQAAPTDPAWDTIANPNLTGAAQNTTLPAWAVDAQGNPLQPSTLQQLIAISSGANNPATAPIGNLATLANTQKLIDASPEIAAELAAAGVGNDGRSPAQWLVDHITQTEANAGGGRFTDYLRNFVATGNPVAPGGTLATPGTPAPAPGTATAPAGPAGTGNNLTVDPAILALLPNATRTVGNIFDGTYLAQQQAALAPIAAARDAAAAAALARINEQRGLSTGVLNTELGGIQDVLAARTAGAGTVRDAATAAAQAVNDANVTKLAALLGVRREAAQAIYDASAQGAAGVRDARTAGAQGIYGAESLQADTYAQSAEQALNRVLAQQAANRARQGFTGGSSGSDILTARTMAGALQQGAGARAQAGTNLANRLSDTGVGYAGDMSAAGVGRATTLGQANESDAVAQLNAAVQLAQSLGLAGTNYAGTTAAAGEQNAIAQLQAKVADATRRLGYLTSDADIAQANADLQNATDSLNAILGNQNRQVGAISAPFTLAGADLSLKNELTDQQYADIDALLKRLSSFSTTPASGPTLTTSTPGSVLNSSQIAGGALTGAGSVIGNVASNADLMSSIQKILDGFKTPAATGTGAATSVATNPPGILSSGNYLAGASVFGGPG